MRYAIFFFHGLDVEIWPKSGVPHHPPELFIHPVWGNRYLHAFLLEIVRRIAAEAAPNSSTMSAAGGDPQREQLLNRYTQKVRAHARAMDHCDL